MLQGYSFQPPPSQCGHSYPHLQKKERCLNFSQSCQVLQLGAFKPRTESLSSELLQRIWFPTEKICLVTALTTALPILIKKTLHVSHLRNLRTGILCCLCTPYLPKYQIITWVLFKKTHSLAILPPKQNLFLETRLWTPVHIFPEHASWTSCSPQSLV